MVKKSLKGINLIKGERNSIIFPRLMVCFPHQEQEWKKAFWSQNF